MARNIHSRRLAAAILLAAGVAMQAAPAAAQPMITASEANRAGEIEVPLNKSQVIRSDRPFAKALIGNPEIADVLPLTDQSLYVLGKKNGTTSLTLYDRRNMLIAVIDVVVGPDVIGLKRQLSEMVAGDGVSARISNESIVLEGIVSSAVAADRAVQLAETYAPNKVVNLLSIGSAQQVMLEVRFSEVKRGALKDIGVSSFSNSNKFEGVIGGGTSLTPDVDDVDGDGNKAEGLIQLGSIIDSFGILSRAFRIAGLDVTAVLNALERKGLVTTLAEPTLIALSGETATFLAGGEFPVPVAQDSGSGGTTITVEFKPFGVSLAFTPTVLADGVINMVVQPEVSSIDPSSSVVINNLRIPGLQTRRAKTVVELRDGQSFAMAGLIRRDFQDTVRQFPILGSIPIIGSLFRSTNFQREETELVIIVTPRLVRPVRAATLKAPTDRVTPPTEAELFMLGRTDSGVPQHDGLPQTITPLKKTPPPPPPPPPAAAPSGGSAKLKPVGFEKEYGHAL